MKESNLFHKILGVVCITTGVVFYVTPVPGTTALIIIGFVFIIGKDRTTLFLKESLSKEIFESLKIEQIIKKI